ncbi:peroxisomal (S)-2-hydroxyacid oxidase GLO3-like [Humulus lupulus]|uniref:peroxisomal (S)-2-hydroxyacid oxidase GLO3-like n=1 Tax=Humulus lupulus TaxID=3486 RepID=UPI002B40EC32|nr:peroxisomal (S)-2-hydroxyacid oxidase GLO3-like [Humulus lupulus]
MEKDGVLERVEGFPDDKMRAKAVADWQRMEELEGSKEIFLLFDVVPISARKAVEARVHGIVVSNHGTRQLDHTPATISVLEEVVQAVGGKVHVIVDGGIRTCCRKILGEMIGRPVIYGLAAMGQHGVKSLIEMLKNEFELTMSLSGCPALKHITGSHVMTQRDSLHSKKPTFHAIFVVVVLRQTSKKLLLQQFARDDVSFLLVPCLMSLVR